MRRFCLGILAGIALGLGLCLIDSSHALARGPSGDCSTIGSRPLEVCAVIGTTCQVGNATGICCTDIHGHNKSECVCMTGVTNCPGLDSACTGLSGPAFGLCKAYCDAQDCADQPGRPSCQQLRENLLKLTGTAIFPCDVPLPTPTPEPVSCCEFPHPVIAGQPVCFDSNACEAKCPLLGGKCLPGFCDPVSERCQQSPPAQEGLVCCECPVDSPPFPDPTYCFDTIQTIKCTSLVDAGCMVVPNASCDPDSEKCRPR